MGYESTELWLAMKQTKYKRTLNYLREVLEEAQGGFNQAVKIAINTVCKTVHSEAGTFWFYSRNGNGNIYPRAVYGGGSMNGITLKPGQGIAGQVIETGKTELISDCSKDPRWANKVDKKTGFVTKSMLCVPLIADGQAFGCLQLINKTDDMLFDHDDADLVEALAEEISDIFVSQHLLSDGRTENYVAVLYADLRGFYNVTDAMDAMELTEAVNKYHDYVTRIITENGGVANVSVGSSIMAYWIGDAYEKNVAYASCHAGRELVENINHLRESIGGEKSSMLEIGVGIDYGKAYIGNVGTGALNDYTVFGTPVSTAAYLSTNVSDGKVLITKAVRDAVQTQSSASATLNGFRKSKLKKYQLERLF